MYRMESLGKAHTHRGDEIHRLTIYVTGRGRVHQKRTREVAMASEVWCGQRTGLLARCPFHDRGERFSCSLALTPNASEHQREQLCLAGAVATPLCSTLAGRRLILIGDSLMQQLYDTIRCHICGTHRAALVPEAACNPSSCRTRTITRRWSRDQKLSQHDFGLCGSVDFQPAGTLKPPSLSDALTRLDAAGELPNASIVLLNDGVWFSPNPWSDLPSRGVGHAVRDARFRAEATLATIRRLGLRTDRRICVLWRETSPQHFAGSDHLRGSFPGRGEPTFDSKRGCSAHRPSKNGLASSLWEPLNAWLESRGLPVVRLWQDSAAHHDLHLGMRTAYVQHKGTSDCTHWCSPGVVDMWVPLLRNAVLKYCG